MRKYKIYDRINRPKLSYPEPQQDYEEIVMHQQKRSTGEGVDDFEIIDVEEIKKTNINEFVNSFKDQVGIEAVMKRVSLTGDLSLLNQVQTVHSDTTVIPEDPEEAFEKAITTEKAFEEIDKDLKGDQTMEDFIKTLTPEKLEAYINKKVAEKQKKEGNE